MFVFFLTAIFAQVKPGTLTSNGTIKPSGLASSQLAPLLSINIKCYRLLEFNDLFVLGARRMVNLPIICQYKGPSCSTESVRRQIKSEQSRQGKANSNMIFKSICQERAEMLISLESLFQDLNRGSGNDYFYPSSPSASLEPIIVSVFH